MKSDINVSFNENFNVIIDTPNYQTSGNNGILLEYRPDNNITYESYEILIGTTPTNLTSYAVMQDRNITVKNLQYATTYYVEIYGVDFMGTRLSSNPSKLTFTTGFDTREINEQPVVTVEEISSDKIVLSWTNVENADEYYICRKENDSTLECFVKTTETTFTDNINILEGTTYTYQIHAKNGYTSNASTETNDVFTPVSFNDTDNDGMPNDWEETYGLNIAYDDSSFDKDYDGLTNLKEYTLGTNPTIKDEIIQLNLSQRKVILDENFNEHNISIKINIARFIQPVSAATIKYMVSTNPPLSSSLSRSI